MGGFEASSLFAADATRSRACASPPTAAPALAIKAPEVAEEKEAIAQQGSADSGASLRAGFLWCEAPGKVVLKESATEPRLATQRY
jgi:hypothetical protein